MAENPGKKLISFFADAKQELKKVSWPAFEDLKSSTIVVMVSILLLAVFIGGVDFILSKLVQMIIH